MTSKKEGVADWKVPIDVHGVRSFLCWRSHFQFPFNVEVARKLFVIADYSEMIAPFIDSNGSGITCN
jgi:hypothetical protein